MHGSLKVVGATLACALAIQVVTAFAAPRGDAEPSAHPASGAGAAARAARGSAPVRRAAKDAIERALERALTGEAAVATASAVRIDGEAFYDADSDMLQSSCANGPASYIAESFSATSGGPTMDGWSLWTKGALLRMHDFGSERSVLSVRARGRFGGDGWPRLVVTIGGEPVGEALVDSATFGDYQFALVGTGAHEIGVWFDNDYYDQPNGDDRNLYVDSVSIAPICP